MPRAEVPHDDMAAAFFLDPLPDLEEADAHAYDEFATAMLEKHFKPIEGHDWYFNGMSKESLEKVQKGFEARYGKGALK